jgi:arylsulfatase A-like enzyme
MCDHNLGRVLDLFDRYDLWKDTMLIVGTDHGFLLAEHDFWGKNKMPYYNEIAHTPLFIYDPRYDVRGEKRESLVQMIDWMPTILNYFGQEIPEDVQGKVIDDVIVKDTPIHDAVLYGTFSGQVNITDGDYAYMRAALPEYKDEVYNYTLVPHHMTKRFTVKEMQDVELSEPFSFTKGMPLLKIKSKDKYNVNRFGTVLYDLKKDPGEECAIEDLAVEKRLRKKMKELMKETDAPKEQFVRYGLEEE